MTKKQRLQVDAAYENNHLVAQDMLAHISELLTDMPAPDGECKIDWGHVGTVTHVNEMLSQIIEFLTPEE